MFTFRQVYNLLLSADRVFAREIRNISGFSPKEVFLYKLALSHSSVLGGGALKQPSDAAKLTNERLEFLGDSILDAIVAEYLFKIYPLKDEGFLTEMRSKIVNRKSLNDLCRKLHLDTLIVHQQNGIVNESMYGDALEAFIGALYVDLGFERTKKFIHTKIIAPLIHLQSVEEQVVSYKNKLIEYTQKTKMGALHFDTVNESGNGHQKTFTVHAKVGDKILGTGTGKNKKTAEQRASEDALKKMKVDLGAERD